MGLHNLQHTAAVLNYDFPESAISYIHRVGRTGRAGREGTAVTLFTEEDGAHGELRSIVNVMRASGCSIPDWCVRRFASRVDWSDWSRAAPYHSYASRGGLVAQSLNLGRDATPSC
jgi:superfamily II DNA/RNA helicase